MADRRLKPPQNLTNATRPRLVGGAPSIFASSTPPARISPQSSFETSLRMARETERLSPESLPYFNRPVPVNPPDVMEIEAASVPTSPAPVPNRMGIPDANVDTVNSPYPRRVISGRGEGFLSGLGAGVITAGEGANVGEKIGGALVGGITGLVAPQRIGDYLTENVDRPRYEAEQYRRLKLEDAANDSAYRRLQMQDVQNRMGDRETDNERQKQEFDARMTYNREQAAALRAQRQAAIANQRIDDYVRLNPGKAIPKNLATEAGRPELADQVIPPTKVTPHWVQDNSGRWVDVSGSEPRYSGVQGKNPNEITPYQREQLNRQDTDDARAENKDFQARTKEAQAFASKFEAAKKRVTEAAAKATALGKNPTTDQEKISRDKAVAEWEAAEAEFNGLREQVGAYSDVLEMDKSGVGVRLRPEVKQRLQAVPRRMGSKSASRTRLTISEADLRGAADMKFGGDVEKARQEAIRRGYQIVP